MVLALCSGHGVNGAAPADDRYVRLSTQTCVFNISAQFLVLQAMLDHFVDFVEAPLAQLPSLASEKTSLHIVLSLTIFIWLF